MIQSFDKITCQSYKTFSWYKLEAQSLLNFVDSFEVTKRSEMKLYVIFLIYLTWNFNALHIDCVINGLNSPHKPYSVYIEFTNSDGLWMAGAGSLIDNYKVLTSRNVVMHK